MELIDTHCHLTYAAPDALSQIFENAKNVGVTKFICIGAGDGTDSAFRAVELADKYRHVWASIGVHPHDAAKAQNLDALEPLVSHPKVVAIGETGLDFFRDWAPREAQFALFRSSIAFARKHKKPLIIHSRDAAEDVIQVLEEQNASDVGGVFHCYSEDAEFAKRLRKINFLVSFTGNITFKKAEALRETVKQIPLDQIMLETDMPYMAPEPFRGKESEPMHVYQVALKMAEVKETSVEEIALGTSSNAHKLFDIS